MSEGRYPCHLSDEELARFAQAAAAGSHHDPSIWSENAADIPVPHMVAAIHDAAGSATGHTLAGQLAAVHGELEHTGLAAKDAEHRAQQSIDDHEDAQRRKIGLAQQIEDEGLEPPSQRRKRGYLAALVALVLGDLTLISIAFQLLGLSDRLKLGFLPFSSDLDIGASTSVFALLVLAHFAGKHLRSFLHDIERRRKTTDTGARAKLPLASRVHLGMTVGLAVMALGVLLGVAVIRADYLNASNVSSEFMPFLAIQMGVFAAALALSYHHAHPYEKEFAHTEAHAGAAEAQMSADCERHSALVARFNALIHHRSALLAQAVHHFELSGANARRLIQLYQFEIRRHATEPISDRLVDPKKLPQPASPARDELLELLIGPIELAKFEPISNDRVLERREQCREALQELRRNRRSVGVTGSDAAPAEQQSSIRVPPAGSEPEVDLSEVERPPAEAIAGNGGGRS